MVYNGQTGVWMSESRYRQYREDQRKGFTYYSNWKISEVQLIRSDSIAETFKAERDMFETGMQNAEAVLETCVATNDEAGVKINELLVQNGRLQKVKKLLPYIAGGSFLVGIGVGILTSSKASSVR